MRCKDFERALEGVRDTTPDDLATRGAIQELEAHARQCAPCEALRRAELRLSEALAAARRVRAAAPAIDLLPALRQRLAAPAPRRTGFALAAGLAAAAVVALLLLAGVRAGLAPTQAPGSPERAATEAAPLLWSNGDMEVVASPGLRPTLTAPAAEARLIVEYDL